MRQVNHTSCVNIPFSVVAYRENMEQKVQHRVFIQTLNLQSNPKGQLSFIANDEEGRKHEQYLCHLLLNCC